MAARTPLTFSDSDLETLREDRYRHPDPRVQQRMQTLLLVSQGHTRREAGKGAGVSRATVERYVKIYRESGVDGLRHFKWRGPVSELDEHRTTIEASFAERPPRTVAEACERIRVETGVERKPTQVRLFLKKSWD